MKLSKISGLAAACLIFAGMISSCSIGKLALPKTVDVPLIVSNQSVPNTYRDLDKTVRVQVNSSVSRDGMYNDDNLPKKYKMLRPEYVFTPSVSIFAEDATISYMQKMHFDVTQSGEYCLKINVRTFKLMWLDKETTECRVVLEYCLVNGAGETVVPTATASSNVKLAQTEQFGNGFGRAYHEALNRIDWDRIARCLMVKKTAKEEKNARVQGNGDTALEHTVIRWFIQSAPQGADVSWRVVSSTPDVANTNSNFVGTTPYETTESFDIKGMTYNNSGNIQIEVTCEKAGYITQRKRFNLRQAIDQKEISAKFNLIKDE